MVQLTPDWAPFARRCPGSVPESISSISSIGPRHVMDWMDFMDKMDRAARAVPPPLPAPVGDDAEVIGVGLVEGVVGGG